MSSSQNTGTFLSKMNNLFVREPKKDDAITQIASSTPASAMTGGGVSPVQNQPSINIDKIFADALARGASDVHIEPGENSLKIRMRVDGGFVEYANLGDSEKSSLIARIKILSSLKIDEQRLPQDGKASYHDPVSGKDVDLRVSIIPTIYGEKVVIRILKKESELMDLRSIGVLPMNMIKIKKHLEDQFGLILIVGPTGSGKSTTLYSMLSNFDPEEKNISTLEDPVEYRIK